MRLIQGQWFYYLLKRVCVLFTFTESNKNIIKMTDSEDSDYNVEEYVIPDTIRRTYNNEDLLSDEEQETGSSESEQEGNEEPEQDVTNSYCKLANGNGEISSSNQEEVVDEPVRPNSRYILYVTNLTSETTKSMLEDFFSDAGEVKAIRIPKVRLGSFAFVEMKEFEGFKVRSNKELLSICRTYIIYNLKLCF